MSNSNQLPQLQLSQSTMIRQTTPLIESWLIVLQLALHSIPIAILLVWLNVPWWGVALTIGVSVFAFSTATHDTAISGKMVAVSFGLAIFLCIASGVVAESMHTSLAALVENYSVDKYVRRLPEYALSALAFSVAAGISWMIRRVRSSS